MPSNDVARITFGLRAFGLLRRIAAFARPFWRVVGGPAPPSEISQKMVHDCTPPHRAAVVRVVLFLVAALAMTPRNTVAVSVGSFSELELSVGSGDRAIEITAPNVLFDYQLEVRQTGTPLHIASGIGATLSGGGHQTRLFFLHNGSKLSLRGVDLVGGVASGTCLECPHGGAIFLSVGSELTLRSILVMDNTAAD